MVDLEDLPDQPDAATPASGQGAGTSASSSSGAGGALGASGDTPDPLEQLPSSETPLGRSLLDASKTDPDHAAKVIALARKMEQPEAFIDRNLPAAQAAAASPDGTFLQQFQAKSPKAAQFLLDRSNMAVARDDLPNLAEHEGLFQRFSDVVSGARRAWDSGSLQEQLGFSRYSQLTGQATPGAESQIADLHSKMDALQAQKPTSLVGRGLYGATEFAPQILGAGETGLKYALPAAGAAAGLSLVAGPGAPIAEAVTVPGAFSVGMTAGGLEYNFKLMSGLAYDQMKAVRDKDGNPLPDEVAKPAALATGAAAAGLGLLKLDAVLKSIPGGRQFMTAFAADAGAQVLEKQGYAQALSAFAKRWASSAAEGAGAMTAITATNIAGIEGAKAASGQPFDHPGVGEVASQLGETAADAALTFGVMGLPGSAYRLGSDAVRARGHGELASQLTTAAGDAAARSKLLERLPEGYQAAMKQVAGGSGAETTYIPADSFDTYFQKKDMDPGLEAMRLGVTAEYQQAKETGGDIPIPTETFLSTYGKTEHVKGLADDVKFDPGAITLNQERAIGEEAKAQLEETHKAAQAEIAKDETKQAGYDQVYKYIQEQRQAAKPEGLSARQEKAWQKEVDASATLWASRAVTEAGKRGIPVEEYFQGLVRPQVVNGEAPGAASGTHPLFQRGGGELKTYEHSDEIPDYPGRELSDRISKVQHAPIEHVSPSESVSEASVEKMMAAMKAGEPLPAIVGEFGYNEKNPGLDRVDVVDGHTRLEAAKRLGMTHVPVRMKVAADDWAQVKKNGGMSLRFYENPLNQERAVAPTFYSRLTRTVEDKMGGSATPEQINGMLREVKPEERKYSGLDEFLAGKQKVSKSELLDFLNERQIEVKEVTKGDSPEQYVVYADGEKQATFATHEEAEQYVEDSTNSMMDELRATSDKMSEEDEDYYREQEENRYHIGSTADEQGATKFHQYALPGGENYREMLFTLPGAGTENGRWEYVTGSGERKVAFDEADAKKKAAETGGTARPARDTYKSSHWEERNVLAHTRLSDRVDAEGKRVLHVEEIQSDWHQDGRKKGYQGQEIKLPEGYSVKEDENEKRPDHRFQVIGPDGRIAGLGRTEERALNDYAGVTQKSVPDAPFKKTWHEFVMKRLLRMAAEGGYDKLAWTKGAEQAERYDLSKQVSKIVDDNGVLIARAHDGEALYAKETPESEWESVIGKEAAAKLAAQTPDESGLRVLEGAGLKMGGEGMKGFYDKILPEYLNKYAKKWGAKVGETELSGASPELARLDVLRERDGYHVYQGEKDIGGGAFETAEDAHDYASGYLKDNAPPVKLHSIDITPPMKDAVLHEGQTLFQEGDKPQGSVTLGSASSVIQLFKTADASTFMHESAHIWLKDAFDYVRSAGDALPDTYKNDWETLSSWLGVGTEQAELTREQQEKFARGFEAYLREGNAPSEGLKRAFTSFRSWLTKIYREVQGKIPGLNNVELSDPVREVLDRMLASEDEIAAAERDVAYQPLPEDLAGVPDAVRARLGTLQERAHEEAVSTLLKRQMDEIKADRKKFLADKRAELEAQARKELATDPTYVAQEDLREKLETKKSPRALASDYLNGRLSDEKQAIFDGHAEIAGYTSGEEMAQSIQRLPTPDEAVKQQVDAQMAKFADLKNTDVIRGEALRAVHSEHMVELMALEREALLGLIKKAEINEEAKSRRAAEARAEAKAVKQQAREMSERLNVRAASSFTPLFTAERRAAVKLAKALGEGDYAAAAAFKRQQMLNHALAIEALAVRKKVDKWTSYLAEIRGKPADFFGNQEHFFQAAEVLRRLGFERRDYDPANRKESLAQWVNRMQQVTNTVDLPNWILDESQIKPYQDLKVSQFQDAVNAVKNIVQVARFEDRAYSIQAGAELSAIVSNLRIASGLNGIDKTANVPPMVPGKLDGAKGLVNKYLLSLTKPQTLLLKLDGYRDGGKWSSVFWDSVHAAANDESVRMAAAKDGLEEVWSVYSPKERAEMVEKKVAYPELGTSATKMHLIMMALNLGNEDNRTKLFGTPPVGLDGAVHWDEATGMALLQKHLDARDWKFVQSVWTLINKLWPDLASVHKELTGFEPEKVQAEPFEVTSKDGEKLSLEGGYFPLKEDPRANVRANLRQEIDSPLYTEQNPGWMAATKTGHTKARTGAQYSVSLSPAIIHNHLRDVIHDIALRGTVIDLRRLLMNRELQGIITSNVGMEGYGVLRDWVQAVAGGNTEATDALSSVVRTLRNRATIASIFIRPSVFLQHLANPLLYAGAVEGFGWKQVFNGLIKRGFLDYHQKALWDWKGMAADRDAVYQLSPFMRDTHNAPDRSLGEAYKTLTGGDSKLQAFASHLIGGTLELTSIPMWKEAYQVGLERHLGDQAEAIRYADKLIDRVQGSGRKYDSPGIQRGGELGRSLSMFYTFLSAEYNRWSVETGRARLDPSQTPRFLGFMASRLLLFTTVSGVLAGRYSGDDEDKVKTWLKETLGYPMAMFPGLRDISSVALDQALGLKSFGYRPSPAASAIEAGLDTAKQVGGYARGQTEGQRVLESASKSAAYLFPYPDQLNAWFWNGYDSFANGMHPQVSDLYRRRPRKDR